jgi:hypothetical protein
MIFDQDRSCDLAFSAMLGQLNRLVCVALGVPVDFDLKWGAIVSAFTVWLRGLPAAISPLSRNLELLRRIENEFHASSLRQNEAISNLLLGGTAKPGERVTIHGQSWLILSRAVSINYGVEYTLVNEKGEQLRHEFFD